MPITNQLLSAHGPKKKKERVAPASRIFDNLIDRETGLYFPEYFREMLNLEIRRTERSRKSFLLFIVDFEDCILSSISIEKMGEFCSMLNTLTRETDIKGWYDNPYAVGIIFTESPEGSRELLIKKITDGLSTVFNETIMRHIGVRCMCYPEDLGNSEDRAGDTSILEFPETSPKTISNAAYVAAKRTLDIVGSVLAIILFSPIFITIPILIKLTSRGPVFFKQTRIGLNGEKFTFLKFRSMRVNNDCTIHKNYVTDYIKGKQQVDQETKQFKLVHDPRVTSIGRIIRKTSIDELPQVFNVLQGTMSLVGPRPALPYETAQYDVWHKRRLLSIKPGITGAWQVNGRNKTTFDMMVRMDIRYIKSWTPWLDIKLLAKTPFAVIKGAY
jgi:lipopolysaccharide/colanic/teichoic acid biosynthesis glycosyltransferase